MRSLKIFFVSVGLALLLSTVLAACADYFGILFGGLDIFIVILLATVFCALAVPLTAFHYRCAGKHFRWRTCIVEVSLLVLVIVGGLSWRLRSSELKMFMNPAPVPSGIRIIRGCSVLFGSYVHFSAPPAVIDAIVRAKGLVKIPDNPPDREDLVQGYHERQRTFLFLNWWRPAMMANSQFYFRNYKAGEMRAGLNEGWWINGATNEVYAHISD